MGSEAADSDLRGDIPIDHAAAIKYWNTIEPTVNGMLGGYPQVSRIDLQTNANFLAKLRRKHPDPTSSASSRLTRAVDCGAGIGRITAGFLAKVAEVVDIVEPVEKFTHEISDGPRFQELRDKGRIGEIYNVGLEGWKPRQTYDLIWNQWCVGHLTDAQLLAYLGRCRKALRKRGWIVVKENLSTDVRGDDLFDVVDNSVARSDDKFRSLFQQAKLKVVASEIQRGFPKDLLPVRIYALQPEDL